MNDFVELQQLIAIVLRRWWLLILVIALAASAGFSVSKSQTPVYQATTTILVGQSIKMAQLERVDIQTSQALVQTYVDIARRKPVLDGVVNELGLTTTWQELRNRVEVDPITDTQLIEIKVEASSPEMAEAMADELARQLLLISPSGAVSSEVDPNDSFNRDQILSLQEKIVNAQKRLDEIAIAIERASPETDLTPLQNEKTTLEGLIIEWERNYTELLPFTMTQPERDPSQLSVIETAHAAEAPIRPRVQLYTILSGALGMVLGLGLIFLLEFADDTYKSLDDIPRSQDIDILGTIGKIRGKKHSGKLIAQLQPYSALTESYRIIRSRIRFKSVDGPTRSFMVTSSMPKEGKSVTASNLAVVFAQANLRTIIVDADLRHPVLHRIFRVENEAGLGDLLGSAELNLEECLQDTSVDNLQILTSGKPLSDPSERLGSERMAEVMAQLKGAAEIVIFDSPPVLVFADAIDLSRRVDGVILMIRARSSKRDAIDQALFDLRNARAKLLGSIFSHSVQNSTVSLRRAYMQERALLPFEKVLRKKLSSSQSQLDEMPDSAMPAEEILELADVDDNEVEAHATEVETVKTASRKNHKRPSQPE